MSLRRRERCRTTSGDPDASDGAPSSVPCPSVAACVAVGSYLDSSSDDKGLLITRSA
jgi:hypothetical protein